MEKFSAHPVVIAVCIAAGATGAALVVVEILLVFLVEPSVDYLHKNLVISLDRRCLYRVKPHCRIDINDWGYRDYEFSTLVTQKTENRILILGDSFVFGDNVASTQTFTKKLEHQLGSTVQCLNFGIIGYGPDQSLLTLTEKGLRLRPSHVILSVFAANDFNDLVKNKLVELDDRENLTLRRKNALTEVLPTLRIKLLLDKVLRKGFFTDASISQFFRRMLYDAYDVLFEHHPETEKKIRLMEKLLTKYRDICAEKHIEFMVVIVPSYENIQNPQYFVGKRIPKEYYFLNEDAVRSICKDNQIEYLDLRETFSENKHILSYDPDDHHFSAAGNHLVAEALKQKLTGVRIR